jgi:hypothetical protein
MMKPWADNIPLCSEGPSTELDGVSQLAYIKHASWACNSRGFCRRKWIRCYWKHKGKGFIVSPQGLWCWIRTTCLVVTFCGPSHRKWVPCHWTSYSTCDNAKYCQFTIFERFYIKFWLDRHTRSRGGKATSYELFSHCNFNFWKLAWLLLFVKSMCCSNSSELTSRFTCLLQTGGDPWAVHSNLDGHCFWYQCGVAIEVHLFADSKHFTGVFLSVFFETLPVTGWFPLKVLLVRSWQLFIRRPTVIRITYGQPFVCE